MPDGTSAPEQIITPEIQAQNALEKQANRAARHSQIQSRVQEKVSTIL